MAARGAKVVGVDLMAGMLREARAATAHLEPRPAFAQADALALPFADASFDQCSARASCTTSQTANARYARCAACTSGGRTVISKNGAYATRRIYELHADAARELGYEPLPITRGHFTMDDLSLVQQVSPPVERRAVRERIRPMLLNLVSQ